MATKTTPKPTNNKIAADLQAAKLINNAATNVQKMIEGLNLLVENEKLTTLAELEQLKTAQEIALKEYETQAAEWKEQLLMIKTRFETDLREMNSEHENKKWELKNKLVGEFNVLENEVLLNKTEKLKAFAAQINHIVLPKADYDKTMAQHVADISVWQKDLDDARKEIEKFPRDL